MAPEDGAPVEPPETVEQTPDVDGDDDAAQAPPADGAGNGSGNGDPGPRRSSVTSTAGADSPKSRQPKRGNRRKKHGRR